MAAMTSVSLWFALVTVVPGLVTIAALWLAVIAVQGTNLSLPQAIGNSDATVAIAAAVAVMVLTQTMGILLEERLLIPRKWLGRGSRGWNKHFEHALDPFSFHDASSCDQTKHAHAINPYDEYVALYLVLTSLRKDEDAHGHLQRVAAQFFLTLNSIVALLTGIVATLGLLLFVPGRVLEGVAYVVLLALGVVALWLVAANRFALLGWGLWGTRRRRLQEEIAANRRSARLTRAAPATQLAGTISAGLGSVVVAAVGAVLNGWLNRGTRNTRR
jgi:hypothetical protein